MDEELIKKVVKIKFDLLDKFLDYLPERAVHDIKDFGVVLADCIGENINEMKARPAPVPKPEKKLKNIEIE